MGGGAIKSMKDDLLVSGAELSGGAITGTDTSTTVLSYNCNVKTSLTNNGLLVINSYYAGCCGPHSLNLDNGGLITNNGTIEIDAGGGITSMAIVNGNLINNATGIINSRYAGGSYGIVTTYIAPSLFTNTGTINLFGGKLEFSPFTIGGIINIAANTELRASGTIIFNGSLINNNGNVTAPFNFITAAAKVIKGTGTFSSTILLNNAATVTPLPP